MGLRPGEAHHQQESSRLSTHSRPAPGLWPHQNRLLSGEALVGHGSCTGQLARALIAWPWQMPETWGHRPGQRVNCPSSAPLPLQLGPLPKVTEMVSHRPGQDSRSPSPGQLPKPGGFLLRGPAHKAWFFKNLVMQQSSWQLSEGQAMAGESTASTQGPPL